VGRGLLGGLEGVFLWFVFLFIIVGGVLVGCFVVYYVNQTKKDWICLNEFTEVTFWDEESARY
jgi:hypothetical protein